MTETGMPPLRLESIPVGGDRAVLRAAGEVDVSTAGHLRERVIQLVDDGTVHLLADLRPVTFLDPTAPGARAGRLRRLRRRAGSSTLVIGAARLLRILRLTALGRVFVLRP